MDGDILGKIKTELDTYVYNHIDHISRIVDFHNGLQNHIAAMSEMFGLKSVVEYQVGKGKSKYIDVVWMDKEIVYAIEIDSSLKKGSLKKLNRINAENKIWILYCNNIYDCNNDYNYSFYNLMCTYNMNNEISIIYLGAIRQYLRAKIKGKL